MRKLLALLTVGAFVGLATAPAADAKVKLKLPPGLAKLKKKFDNWKPKTKLGKMFKKGIQKVGKKVLAGAKKFVGKLKGFAKKGINKIATGLKNFGQKALGKLGKWNPKTKIGQAIKGGLMKAGKAGLRLIDKGKGILLRKLNRLGPRPTPKKAPPPNPAGK